MRFYSRLPVALKGPIKALIVPFWKAGFGTLGLPLRRKRPRKTAHRKVELSGTPEQEVLDEDVAGYGDQDRLEFSMKPMLACRSKRCAESTASAARPTTSDRPSAAELDVSQLNRLKEVEGDLAQYRGNLMKRKSRTPRALQMTARGSQRPFTTHYLALSS